MKEIFMTEQEVALLKRGGSSLGYKPPRELEIAGIPSVVVDQHNEVLPYWLEHFNEPAVLITIDNHDDCGAGSTKTFESAKMESPNITLVEYARDHVGCARHISTAMFYNSIGVIYWQNPREEYVYSRGRIEDGKQGGVQALATESNFRTGREIIKWADPDQIAMPAVTRIDLPELMRALSGFKGRLILDTDLDGFEDTQDIPYLEIRNSGYKELGRSDELAQLILRATDERMARVHDLLSGIKKPDFISIARSHAVFTGNLDFMFTPPGRIDVLEAQYIQMLKMLYQKRK